MKRNIWAHADFFGSLTYYKLVVFTVFLIFSSTEHFKLVRPDAQPMSNTIIVREFISKFGC